MPFTWSETKATFASWRGSLADATEVVAMRSAATAQANESRRKGDRITGLESARGAHGLLPELGGPPYSHSIVAGGFEEMS